jgi:hypothetical protein
MPELVQVVVADKDVAHPVAVDKEVVAEEDSPYPLTLALKLQRRRKGVFRKIFNVLANFLNPQI